MQDNRIESSGSRKVNGFSRNVLSASRALSWGEACDVEVSSTSEAVSERECLSGNLKSASLASSNLGFFDSEVPRNSSAFRFLYVAE
jgi:hypothetical protein